MPIFSIINSVSFNWMHGVCSGLVLNSLTFTFDSKFKDCAFYCGKHSKLQAIHPHVFLNRIPVKVSVPASVTLDPTSMYNQILINLAYMIKILKF